MILSDKSVERPVLAAVFSLILLIFGIVSFVKLPLREYPDVDPPVVSVETNYIGASAEIIETQITRLIEDRISGIEGIKTISSESKDGQSDVVIEFVVGRDIDAAANDVRDRLSRIVDNLPEEADPPEIFKVDSNTSVIMWLNLSSRNMNQLELTDYADRFLVDRLSVVEGVARVRIGAGRTYAMRIWLDRQALAARGLTVEDVEEALRRENVELPAGRIESIEREFTVRVKRTYKTERDFRNLVISKGDDGYLIKLDDIARVELGAEDYRTEMRGNGEPMIGLGIIKQSRSNTLEVARGIRAEVEKIHSTLPEGTELHNSYDSSVFIEGAINEVYKTLAIAMLLVVIVIYFFLGNIRAVIIPFITVPISVIAAFIFLNAADFSVNILTLLAIVLSIGLVIDDSIVMLENVYKRIEQGIPALTSSFYGARQVGFAIIATSIVLVAVFVPIVFIEGKTGRLFTEFALTMAATVIFSTFIALTLTPMLCSKLLTRKMKINPRVKRFNYLFERLSEKYLSVLRGVFNRPVLIISILAAIMILVVALFNLISKEFAPKEDRGAFFTIVSAPEGTSFQNMRDNMSKIEKDMLTLLETEEAIRILARTPRSFGASAAVNGGIGIIVLEDWSKRRSAFDIMNELRGKFAKHPNIRAFPVMRQGLGGGVSKPLQFVLQGNDYKRLAEIRDIIEEEARNNSGIQGLDSDYKETKPQLKVTIDTTRASDLGVSVRNIGRTIQTMLGSRRVTTFIERGEEYDVILEASKEDSKSISDLNNIYVRSERTGELIPLSNLVIIEEEARSPSLLRFNRMRSITLEANLADGYSLGDAISYLENIVKEKAPDLPAYSLKGQSLDYLESGSSMVFVFALSLLIVYLAMSGQFESFRHPFVIILTVPLAISGAFIGILITGGTLNIYSQIGLIMLIGLAAKNGILIVEFANQRRDAGDDFEEAIFRAAQERFRPIIMTSITTIMGAIPLILSSGAGAETRYTIGVVIFSGVLFATFFTLFVIPVAYKYLARNTGTPQAVHKNRIKQRDENRDLLKKHMGNMFDD
jgi:multidrug efflux pump